jgi:hypothetical protein
MAVHDKSRLHPVPTTGRSVCYQAEHKDAVAMSMPTGIRCTFNHEYSQTMSSERAVRQQEVLKTKMRGASVPCALHTDFNASRKEPSNWRAVYSCIQIGRDLWSTCHHRRRSSPVALRAVEALR